MKYRFSSLPACIHSPNGWRAWPSHARRAGRISASAEGYLRGAALGVAWRFLRGKSPATPRGARGVTPPGKGSVRGGGILVGGIVGLEQAAGELFDLQRPPWWDALPLVNRLWLDVQGFGQRGFAAEVLNHLGSVPK